MDLDKYFVKSELIPAIIQEKSTVIDIYADCDNDTLLITVEQTGAACHTGNHSCFFKKLK